MAGWQEYFGGFKFEDQGTTTIGASASYVIGTGQRQFKQISGGTDSLPIKGEAFYDPAGSISGDLSLIKCEKIVYTNEFIQLGETTCSSGRVATAIYGVTPSDGTDEENEVADSPWTAETRTVLLPPGDYWTFYPNDTPGTILGSEADVNKCTQDLIEHGVPIQTSAGTFSRVKDFQTLTSFTSWVENNFIPAAGKLNDAAFMGFAVGEVLCNSFSKSNIVNDAGNVRIRVQIQFNWMVLPNVPHDSWQCMPAPDGSFKRVIRGDRSPGAGTFVSIEGELYEYADFTTVV